MMALINNTFPLNASLRKKKLKSNAFSIKTTYLIVLTYILLDEILKNARVLMCRAYVATLFLALVYFSTFEYF